VNYTAFVGDDGIVNMKWNISEPKRLPAHECTGPSMLSLMHDDWRCRKIRLKKMNSLLQTQRSVKHVVMRGGSSGMGLISICCLLPRLFATSTVAENYSEPRPWISYEEIETEFELATAPPMLC